MTSAIGETLGFTDRIPDTGPQVQGHISRMADIIDALHAGKFNLPEGHPAASYQPEISDKGRAHFIIGDETHYHSMDAVSAQL